MVEDLGVVDAVHVRLDARTAVECRHEDRHGYKKGHEGRNEESGQADTDGILSCHAYGTDFFEDHLRVAIHLQGGWYNSSERDDPRKQHHPQGPARTHTSVVVVRPDNVDKPVQGDGKSWPQGQRAEEHLDEEPGSADSWS